MKEEKSLQGMKRTVGEETLSPLEQQRASSKVRDEKWPNMHFVMMPMSSSVDSDPTTGGLMLSHV